MAIILTYDDLLSRVQINVTGLNAATDVVTIERSTNQVTWTTVRGGTSLTPSGNAVTLNDYEFNANVTNYYRARAYDTAATAYVTGGPAVTGNNSSLVATMPLGIQNQDLVLIEASIRNSGTGVPNAPAGWFTIIDAGNQKLFGKIVTGAEAAPTVTFTGGVANADTLVQTAAFRRLSLNAGGTVTQLNSVAAQDIPCPTFTPPANNMTVIRCLWKQDDWTTVSAGPAGFNAIQGNGAISTAGDDAAQAWSYSIQTTATTVSSPAAIVTGGTTAISRASYVALYHADLLLSSEVGSITPVLEDVWLKVITKPFLNRNFMCVPNISPKLRKARNGIFPIVNRSAPIAVTDTRLPKEWTFEVITRTTQEWQDFDIILGTGDIIFIHTPPDHPLTTGYVVVGDTQERRPLRNRTCDNDWRVFLLPVTTVVAPNPNIVGSVGTWQTVVNTYATWADVIANHPTWADLLTLVGSPADVVVP